MKGWAQIFDGGSDQWLWARRANVYTYVCVEIIDLPGYCGTDANAQWVAAVSTVDTSDIASALSAVRSHGQQDNVSFYFDGNGTVCWRIEDDYGDPLKGARLAIAEMMHGHGSKSPMWDGSAGTPEHECSRCNGTRYITDPEPPRFRRFEYEAPSLSGEYGWKYRDRDSWSSICGTLRECFDDWMREPSEIECPSCEGYGQIDEDSDEDGTAFQSLKRDAFAETEPLLEAEHRNHLLDTKIVNALGQTAREFASTDGLWETLRRIKADPDSATTEQRLMLKMYRGSGQTLGAGPVPSDIVD